MSATHNLLILLASLPTLPRPQITDLLPASLQLPIRLAQLTPSDIPHPHTRAVSVISALQRLAIAWLVQAGLEAAWRLLQRVYGSISSPGPGTPAAAKRPRRRRWAGVNPHPLLTALTTYLLAVRLSTSLARQAFNAKPARWPMDLVSLVAFGAGLVECWDDVIRLLGSLGAVHMERECTGPG